MKRLWMEWLFMFWVLPVLMLLAGGGVIIPILLMLGTIAVTLYLVRNPEFDRRRFFSREGLGIFARGLMWKTPLVALCLLGITWIIAPDQLFFFPRQRPGIWLMVILFYSVFSAFPQEIIYRAFFFHRYEKLFQNSRLMLVMSAVCFAFVHVAFGNLVGPLLTLPGGLFFSSTYKRHQSVLLAAIEHGLYGALVFTIGLGLYFFHGTMGR